MNAEQGVNVGTVAPMVAQPLGPRRAAVPRGLGRPWSRGGYIGRRVGRDHVEFGFRHARGYIRRKVRLDDLVAFLTGNVERVSNLGPKGEKILFENFSREHYLPKSARHRLKDSSYAREQDAVTALCRYFRDKMLHEIGSEHWEEFKDKRLTGELALRHDKCGEGTVKKEFQALKKILGYGVGLKYLKMNVLAGVKPGLVDGCRADVFLLKEELERLLSHVAGVLRDLFEFRALTGARPTEAALFSRENVNWETGKIWILTIKKKKKAAGPVRRRFFKIKSLGPRFEALLRRMAPHPASGLYFANPETGRPFVERYVQEVFKRAAAAAGIVKRLPLIPYDLRATFAWHRALVVKNFRQLQSEMGHLDPKSIQNYLDESENHDPKASLFYGVDASDNDPE